MSNILVPTDFSKHAEYAFEAACAIALVTDAHVHLYNCMDLPDDWEDKSVEEKMSDHMQNNIAIETRHQLIEWQSRAKAKKVACTYHTTGGNFLKDITKMLEKITVDLIVMGSHGAGGKEEWFIGSNTQKVVRKLQQNVLIVKNPIEELRFRHVTFVSGLHMDDQIAFQSFLEFVEPFQPEQIHVLSIDTSAWFAQPTIVMEEALKDFREIAKGFNCSTHFYKDFSIQAGIRHFVEANNIDLVGISYRIRHPLKRIFLGSNVEMLVNHSNVPVLSIGK